VTVTVGTDEHASSVGLHVRCNRDEQRTRAVAEPPRVVVAGGHAVLMPRDPDGGGTWILANRFGLVACILNRTLPAAAAPPPPARPTSRGLVPLALAGAATLDEAIELALASDLDPARLRPFRLLLAAPGGETAELLHEGDGLGLLRRGPAHREPWLATSSGLGDHLVEGPRGRRFAELVTATVEREGDVHASLDRFHREAWPDAPQLGPWMDRPDAWTSSHTQVVVTDAAVTMQHEDRRTGRTHRAALERATAVFAGARGTREAAG